MKKYFAILALILGLAGSSSGQEHIRFAPGDNPEQDGSLQIAVIEYTAPDGHKITLYGVVHIADPAYYAEVQRELDGFDTVLYEGVKTGTMINPETKILNVIQKGMGKLLGLSFQKDGIDYTRPNLVHADISADELQQSMGDQTLTPFGNLPPETQDQAAPILEMAGDLVSQFLGSNTELQNKLKLQMSQQIAGADFQTNMPPQMYQSIVVDRNQIVMDVLAAERAAHPEKQNIAIFYGAGHMEDFAGRFKTLGYTQTKQRWMTAWKIGNGASAEIPTPEKAPEAPESPR
jgi:hypothetical protein